MSWLRRTVCPSYRPPPILLASVLGQVNGIALRGVPQPARRKVQRPSYEQLLADVQAMSFLAIGGKYGVSDNAVRKWIRWYEYGGEGT